MLMILNKSIKLLTKITNRKSQKQNDKLQINDNSSTYT